MKQQRELELSRCFLLALGIGQSCVEAGDRPDVRVVIGNQHIGIEVTEFHVDEGIARGPGVKTVRQMGENSVREFPWKPYTAGIPNSPYKALEARIGDKINKAAKYDLSGIDELWLLISAQIPDPASLAATFFWDPTMNKGDLDRLFHERLSESCFDCVCLHLMADRVLWIWNEFSGWQNRPANT
ncbi:MAG: hypothetical protein ACYCZR_04450 [Burkholderiales bacterium]